MSRNREPIGHTCRNIDRVIESITDAVKECQFDTDETAEELQRRLETINDHLYRLDRDLEDLRSNNSALRDWGIKEAGRVDELEEEISQLQNA